MTTIEEKNYSCELRELKERITSDLEKKIFRVRDEIRAMSYKYNKDY